MSKPKVVRFPRLNQNKPTVFLRIFKENRLLGMGSGQPNRVKSLQIAMEKAGEEVKGSALASDAFFPFGSSSHPTLLFSSDLQPEMGLCE
jgi:hypothetical protein